MVHDKCMSSDVLLNKRHFHAIVHERRNSIANAQGVRLAFTHWFKRVSYQKTSTGSY